MTRTKQDRRVLIVDDEEAVCWALRRALAQDGYATAVAASAEEALVLAQQQTPDAIILDVRLPGMDGLTALAHLRLLTGNAPVIVTTAFGNLTTAVRAVREGAFDYLTKPFSLEQALHAVARALHPRGPEAPPDTVLQPKPNEPDEIVGASPAMQDVFKDIALVSARDASVLITGESGTGKELVARAIHRHSARCDRPFVPVHLAALNPNLIESELFGHVRGAFTGAEHQRAGLLSLAQGGTIFLDEIADIPLDIQVKLLRVLEYGEFFQVGANQPHQLQVRVLAATHQDLSRKVAEGSFRHDLFFRLNVFQIELPSLRSRPQDIPLLVEHFLRRLGCADIPVPPPTMRHLTEMPWPGNVRQLCNALERATIIAPEGPLLPEHFPVRPLLEGPADQLVDAVRKWLACRLATQGAAEPDGLHGELLGSIEKTLIAEVLQRVRGNRWQAARWLGLNRATVRKKLAEHGIADEPGTAS